MNAKAINYTLAIKELCRDLCQKLPVFRNIDVERIGFSLAKASKRESRYGNWASLTPLRFDGGVLAICEPQKTRAYVGRRSVVVSEVPRYYKLPEVTSPDGASRVIYLFTIMTPRFYNLSVTEKIDTIIHELYHISPFFDGDYRHFPGRNKYHGSMKEYERICSNLRKDWLLSEPNPQLYNFLQLNYEMLLHRYERLFGWQYPKIKLIEISEAEAHRLNPALIKSS